MKTPNPYAPPASVALDISEQPTDEMIENLTISSVWKERFKAIAHAGGPKLPDLKAFQSRNEEKPSLLIY